MNVIKILAVTLVGVALLVVIVQNTAPVETTLLFATITMPRAVLLLLMLLIGFAFGVVTALVLVERGRRQARAEAAVEATRRPVGSGSERRPAPGADRS